jgi:hypothetical protein
VNDVVLLVPLEPVLPATPDVVVLGSPPCPPTVVLPPLVPPAPGPVVEVAVLRV